MDISNVTLTIACFLFAFLEMQTGCNTFIGWNNQFHHLVGVEDRILFDYCEPTLYLSIKNKEH